MATMPWCDCKVAFSIDDADALDATGSFEPFNERMPPGWTLDDIDGTGARWVAVFRVEGTPTVAAGRVAKQALRKVGAIRPRARRTADKGKG